MVGTHLAVASEKATSKVICMRIDRFSGPDDDRGSSPLYPLQPSYGSPTPASEPQRKKRDIPVFAPIGAYL
jgi:hypothetical protein